MLAMGTEGPLEPAIPGATEGVCADAGPLVTTAQLVSMVAMETMEEK